jgi:excisionase family DNA binding protein
MTIAHDEELLTSAEVRERLKISRSTLHRLVVSGTLTKIKIGTVTRYLASEINPTK